jgi:hypothetical protein
VIIITGLSASTESNNTAVNITIGRKKIQTADSSQKHQIGSFGHDVIYDCREKANSHDTNHKKNLRK